MGRELKQVEKISMRLFYIAFYFFKKYLISFID